MRYQAGDQPTSGHRSRRAARPDGIGSPSQSERVGCPATTSSRSPFRRSSHASRGAFSSGPSTFAHLHLAIQESFGWENYHLWECRLPRPLDRVLAGSPNYGDDDYGRPTPDGREVKLNTYFIGKRCLEWCEYEYDFGDSWIHDIKLIGIHSMKEAFKRRLLDGQRACPREDAGGVGGYERCVHFLTTGTDIWDEPDVIGPWIGDWRPEAFDLDASRTRFDK